MFVAILGAGGSLMDMAPKFSNYSRPIQVKSILNKQSWCFFFDIFIFQRSVCYVNFQDQKFDLIYYYIIIYYQVFLWKIKSISDKENNGLLLSYCFMLMLSSRDVLSQVIRSIRLFVERYKEISQDQSHRVASHLYGSCIPHGEKFELLLKFNKFRIKRISYLSQVHIALLLTLTRPLRKNYRSALTHRQFGKK